MRSGTRLNALFWMQLTIGIFFITLGIAALADYNTAFSQIGRSLGRAFGGGSDFMEVVIAILELASGVILVLALFVPIQARALYIACVVILILWALRILYYDVFNSLGEPNFLVWLNRLSLDLIPGIGVWMITGRYR
jgi:hypothetical protein